MRQNSFTKVMLFGTLLFFSIFLVTIFFTKPIDGIFPKLSFFVSLFLSVFCLLSLILFYLKKKATNNELLFISLKSSVRQSFFIASFVVCFFGLSMLRLLTWWDGLLLAFALVLIELYFKSGKVVQDD